MNLADVVPDGDVLVALQPEELGLRILQVLATWSPQIRQIRLGLVLSRKGRRLAKQSRMRAVH
jgi:hypothetical protein